MELVLGLLLLATAQFLRMGLRESFKYPVREDYSVAFAPDRRISCSIAGGGLVFANADDDLAWPDYSILLGVRIESGLAGRVRDPRLIMRAGEDSTTQYFERGACGLRYVDLSRFGDRLAELEIQSKYCGWRGDAELLLFKKPSLDGRLLVVAPHPDDAELAAFGLYSKHAKTSTLVVITAGEHLRRERDQYVPGLGEDLPSACRKKGLMRALDAFTAPAWGGVPREAIVMLGYFDGSLQAMRERRDQIVPHPCDPALSPDYFRRFNQVKLSSDQGTENRWGLLVADLQEIIERLRPNVIVCPHPVLDTHPDHQASAAAVNEALAAAGHEPETRLYYMNHVAGTDEHPFGPPHCTVGPGPWFSRPGTSDFGYLSLPLDLRTQRNKLCSLEAMHDLRLRSRWKRTLQRKAQAIIAGRDWHLYSESGFFRRAVKANEVFLVGTSAAQRVAEANLAVAPGSEEAA